MNSAYFKYVACMIVFLAIGMYDVMDNFKGLTGSVALLMLLLGAMVGSFMKAIRTRMWKLFFTGLCGFILSTIVGSMFNSSVQRAASEVVAAVYAYKEQTGVYPESLMQVATPANMKSLTRKRIKYGSRVHYMRTDEGFALFYDNYAFNGQTWDMDKKAFAEMVD